MHSFLTDCAKRGAARRSLQIMALGLALLACACRAPGMKLAATASAIPTQVEMAGVQVTLRALNEDAIRHQSRPLDEEGLQELLAAKPTNYRIGPQDILQITIWDHPELTLPLGPQRTDNSVGTLVDGDGYIYYPYLGRVLVAGLTSEEARIKLTTALDKFLQSPQVDVKVLAFRSRKVFVGGEVRVPAVYPITDVPFTLAEAVNRAGGFLPTADASHIVLSRGEKSWTLNFMELLKKGNRINQLLLLEGDSVQVPSRSEAPVYLLGELRNPTSVPLYHGSISLAQAISDAGGISNTSADARSIYVLRGSQPGKIEVFHLDASNPVAIVVADRFRLQPRDVVFVDAGPLVRWNRVVGLLVPTVSALTSTASEVKFLSE